MADRGMFPDHEDRFLGKACFVQREDRIRAHFLVCFLSLLCYRLFEKKLGNKYTCRAILDTLKDMNFAQIEDQGFMPVYTRSKLTDDLHKAAVSELIISSSPKAP